MNEALELLKQTKAILTDDHFVGTSGRHMSVYINKDALYPHTEATSQIGELFAEKNKDPIDFTMRLTRWSINVLLIFYQNGRMDPKD